MPHETVQTTELDWTPLVFIAATLLAVVVLTVAAG
jgi:hypothetical protein